ncbi:MAG: hypothetical protein DSZ21_02680 [Tenericutes bacterium]|nr:MAG: hypothetical protein DSZ21_02680 [Mycoplasmatota bacterium]
MLVASLLPIGKKNVLKSFLYFSYKFVISFFKSKIIFKSPFLIIGFKSSAILTRVFKSFLTTPLFSEAAKAISEDKPSVRTS